MSNEVKSEVESVEVEKVVTTERGERGEIGTGTPGSRLKRLHAQTGRGLSLKTFVKDQAKAGNADAKTWIDNKKRLNEMERTKETIARILLQKNATKMAKKSKGKSGGGGKSSVDGTV